jgi:invasion protein IalB
MALMTAVLSAGLASAQTARSPKSTAPAASGAGPVNSPQVSTSTSTFEDWIVRCEVKPPAAKVCEAVQSIAARNQQQQQSVIAEVVFGRLTKTEPFKLIVQLPPGVYLPSGVRLVLDDKTPPLAATFTRCQQSCMAEAELKPETVQILKGKTKTEPGRLEFEDGAHHQVRLPLSFKGLPAALAAREEQS